MKRLAIDEHAIRPERVVEVFDEQGQSLAAIYPTNTGIRIISNHFIALRRLPGQPRAWEFDFERK